MRSASIRTLGRLFLFPLPLVRVTVAALLLLLMTTLLVSEIGPHAYATSSTRMASVDTGQNKASVAEGTCEGWRIVDVPHLAYASSSSLRDVFAVASNDVWAVGLSDISDHSETLIEHWDGQNWTMFPNVSPGEEINVLTALAGASANDVWAVGSYGLVSDYATTATLIAHWDGSTWSRIPSPNPDFRGSSLADVVAFSANDAWAVGTTYSMSLQAKTLILHWDGVAWSVVPSPNYSTGTGDPQMNHLTAISASAPDDIWATGYYNDSAQSYWRSLVLHWDGSAWSLVPDPPNQLTYNAPLDIVALSETDVWSAGFAFSGNGDYDNHPMVQHWDGEDWHLVQDATTDATASLNGIDALYAENIWAVGSRAEPSNPNLYRTLIERWNGASWSVVPSPNMFNGEYNVSTELESVEALAPDDIWAVGSYYQGGGAHTGEPAWPFAIHYSTGSCATATPIPTVTPTRTPVPVATVVGCGLEFEDVPPGSTFYPYARCLTCKGSISGYECGWSNPATGAYEPCGVDRKPYFRPANPVSRGQIAKMVSQSADFNDPPGEQIYEDVPPGSTFYDFVQRLSRRGVMSGYPCAQVPAEPCVPPANRPYFRPDALATRGQLSKIVSNAAEFDDEPTTQEFEDVPPTNPFYIWVERLAGRHVMGGYPCGSVDEEPCVAPGNRPYFRYGSMVTRGQGAKIVANAFFPNCDQATPTPTTTATSLVTVTPTVTPGTARKVP